MELRAVVEGHWLILSSLYSTVSLNLCEEYLNVMTMQSHSRVKTFQFLVLVVALLLRPL